MGDKSRIGGQAVIEGVMIRNKDRTSVAVRKPDGNVEVKDMSFSSLTKKKFFRWPLVRGGIAFLENLYMGMKALSWAAKQAGEEEEEMTTWEIVGTIAFSLLLALVLFKLLPLAMASFVPSSNNILFNLVDGITKIAILLLYMWGISHMEDVHRMFQYHGAEHKTIKCYDEGKELTKENIQKMSKENPGCGTSFIIFVLLVSILFYMVIPLSSSFWTKYILRILLLPLIAGVTYEFISLARYKDNWFLNALVYPGIALQYITTKEPEDDMIEVAVEALKAVTD